MSGTLKGGYEEGMPLTYNTMSEIPGVKETPTLEYALARGMQSAGHNRVGMEGLDLRNFRRSNWRKGQQVK